MSNLKQRMPTGSRHQRNIQTEPTEVSLIPKRVLLKSQRTYCTRRQTPEGSIRKCRSRHPGHRSTSRTDSKSQGSTRVGWSSAKVGHSPRLTNDNRCTRSWIVFLEGAVVAEYICLTTVQTTLGPVKFHDNQVDRQTSYYA